MNTSDRFQLRVLKDGVMVLQKNDEPTTKEFSEIGEVLNFLRREGEKTDARLTVIGFDGRKLIETFV